MSFRREAYLDALYAVGVQPCFDQDCAILPRSLGVHTHGGCSCTDKLGRVMPRTDLRRRALALATIARAEQVDVGELACGRLCVLRVEPDPMVLTHPLGPLLACACVAPDRPLLLRWVRRVAAAIRDHYGWSES